MGQNNGNASRPKLEPELNQEVWVRLLKDKPYTGDNSFGKYYLYSVANIETNEELAFFAPDYIHAIIEERKLGKGSEFIVKKIPFQNGNKKVTSKLELSLVGANVPPPASLDPKQDNFKEMMRGCILDALQLKREIEGLELDREDIRSLSSTLFIARSRQ
jgi:hypothetical protein